MQYFLPVFLLLLANVFMTIAWYGHLKLNQMGISTNWPLIAIILFSWGIAFIEYCFQIPANKMGFIDNGGPYTLLQLKVIQEILRPCQHLFPRRTTCMESFRSIWMLNYGGGIRFLEIVNF